MKHISQHINESVSVNEAMDTTTMFNLFSVEYKSMIDKFAKQVAKGLKQNGFKVKTTEVKKDSTFSANDFSFNIITATETFNILFRSNSLNELKYNISVTVDQSSFKGEFDKEWQYIADMTDASDNPVKAYEGLKMFIQWYAKNSQAVNGHT